MRRRASAAARRAERAGAARLRLNYRAAAAHFAEAATIVANDDDATWNYRLSQADVLYDQGSEFGDNAALAEAIGAYRDALRLVPRDRVPLDWAMTQNNLGSALQTLGARESGTARLEEAVAAYRAALEERTRDRVPLDWAMTQNNLGIALGRLGSGRAGRRVLRRRSRLTARRWRNTRAIGCRCMGDDPEQPRQRASDARGAGERDGAS